MAEPFNSETSTFRCPFCGYGAAEYGLLLHMEEFHAEGNSPFVATYDREASTGGGGGVGANAPDATRSEQSTSVTAPHSNNQASPARMRPQAASWHVPNGPFAAPSPHGESFSNSDDDDNDSAFDDSGKAVSDNEADEFAECPMDGCHELLRTLEMAYHIDLHEALDAQDETEPDTEPNDLTSTAKSPAAGQGSDMNRARSTKGKGKELSAFIAVDDRTDHPSPHLSHSSPPLSADSSRPPHRRHRVSRSGSYDHSHGDGKASPIGPASKSSNRVHDDAPKRHDSQKAHRTHRHESDHGSARDRPREYSWDHNRKHHPESRPGDQAARDLRQHRRENQRDHEPLDAKASLAAVAASQAQLASGSSKTLSSWLAYFSGKDNKRVSPTPASAQQSVGHSATSKKGSAKRDIVRLGKAELGKYAHEDRMPDWLAIYLKREWGVCQKGVIPVLKQLLEQSSTTEYAYLCDPCVQHVSRLPKEGGFCGYRNIQTMVSYIIGSKFPGHSIFEGDLPTIFEIQDMIENAWENGINARARLETGGIRFTRKYIGTPEVMAMLENLQIPCGVRAFNSREPGRAADMLLSDVERYFQMGKFKPGRKVRATTLPPIYWQRPSHSLTIVGIEKTRAGDTNLLVFDPIFKDGSQMARLVGHRYLDVPLPDRLLKMYRRGHRYYDQFRMFEILKLTPKPEDLSVVHLPIRNDH